MRYLTFEMYMPAGVNVTEISVYTGLDPVYQSPVNWAGKDKEKEYMLDMGSYKYMKKGITVGMTIQNANAGSRTLFLYGAGAKQEW